MNGRGFATMAATLAAAVLLTGCSADQSEGVPRKPVASGKPAAASPEPVVPMLLIPDELPFSLMTFRVKTANVEDRVPASSCQQASVATLSPNRIWHRSFSADQNKRVGLSAVEARQVVAQFGSDSAASAAFRTIDGWFAECRRTEDGRKTHTRAAIREAGGRAEFLDVLRYVLKEVPGQAVSGDVIESSFYGINGRAVTIVAVSSRFELPEEEFGQFDSLTVAARMALQRLGGERTLTENEVPRTFRFAEEKHRLAHRRLRILDATYTTGCSPQHMAETRPLRTGSLNADPWVGKFGGYRDLALYEDEPTAKRAARDLKAADTTCGKWQDVPSADEGVHIAILPRTDGQPDAAMARAVAQWGNAVFVATAGDLGPISRSTTISEVRAAVAANRPLVCKVARGCP